MSGPPRKDAFAPPQPVLSRLKFDKKFERDESLVILSHFAYLFNCLDFKYKSIIQQLVNMRPPTAREKKASHATTDRKRLRKVRE